MEGCRGFLDPDTAWHMPSTLLLAYAVCLTCLTLHSIKTLVLSLRERVQAKLPAYGKKLVADFASNPCSVGTEQIAQSRPPAERLKRDR